MSSMEASCLTTLSPYSNSNKTTVVHILLIQAPGYSSELTEEAMTDYEYPNGKVWQELFKAGKFVKPNNL